MGDLFLILMMAKEEILNGSEWAVLVFFQKEPSLCFTSEQI